ncbi:uncharacterized protein LOC132331780 isoform X2 [Haemorhous mexicanus]|uniref:uncharacterized protein LOC132331780 isoform X2 n=1 Tax=Haemorhous mexicanus TaxID=30427 RepID=UPI0028BD8A56|nr:uncharacterized protein LOC132331780 isoform X2 [Haemorhous mexicanus]
MGLELGVAHNRSETPAHPVSPGPAFTSFFLKRFAVSSPSHLALPRSTRDPSESPQPRRREEPAGPCPGHPRGCFFRCLRLDCTFPSAVCFSFSFFLFFFFGCCLILLPPLRGSPRSAARPANPGPAGLGGSGSGFKSGALCAPEPAGAPHRQLPGPDRDVPCCVVLCRAAGSRRRREEPWTSLHRQPRDPSIPLGRYFILPPCTPINVPGLPPRRFAGSGLVGFYYLFTSFFISFFFFFFLYPSSFFPPSHPLGWDGGADGVVLMAPEQAEVSGLLEPGCCSLVDMSGLVGDSSVSLLLRVGSAAVPKLCRVLGSRKVPPGVSSGGWSQLTHHRSAGEASGLTGKCEGPGPLPRGKSPSEPLVNLDAITALLRQSHQPCVSRGWRRHRSQPPTVPPFLTPVVRGTLLPRLLPGA